MLRYVNSITVNDAKVCELLQYVFSSIWLSAKVFNTLSGCIATNDVFPSSQD